MSFILEALKKSEDERQRKIGPSLADVQSRARSSEKPWWAVAVGALLLINLAVLLVVLMRNDDATPAQQPIATQPVADRPAAPARTTSIAAVEPPARPVERSMSVAGNPAVRSLADEAAGPLLEPYAYENPQLAAAANVPDGPPIVRSIQPPAVAPSSSAPAYVPQPTEPTEVLPTMRDLAAGGTQLPELHLDIHVHSPNAAERFVFVNMRKYIEGQALSEGPAVERITPDGVVLNHRGMRFLLPRQ